MPTYIQIVDFIKNSRIVREAKQYLTVIPDYLRASLSRSCDVRDFANTSTYVMFIGSGRSGTTLLGSCLDAHPQIIIANQQNTLKYLTFKAFDRRRIYTLLVENSRRASQSKRMGGGGYSYYVPEQWQGRFERLRVIGDKSMSAQAVERIYRNPSLLRRLREVSGAKLRLIHLIRNPYDTITTKAIRRKLPLRTMIREYFTCCERLQQVLRLIEQESPENIQRVPVVLEEFIQNPTGELARVCEKLGVEAEPDFLKSCAGIVYKKPHLSRHRLPWDQVHRNEVKMQMKRFPFLAGYEFGT